MRRGEGREVQLEPGVFHWDAPLSLHLGGWMDVMPHKPLIPSLFWSLVPLIKAFELIGMVQTAQQYT